MKSLLRSPSFWLLGFLAALSVLSIYQNHIYRYFLRKDYYQFSQQIGAISVDLSKPIKSENEWNIKRHQVLKVSLPIEDSKLGCEFVYGAAVYEYPRDDEDLRYLYAFKSTRYIFKFRYDLKNRRCESKDLFILPTDVPTKITLQIIDVEWDDHEIRERARKNGLEIKFPKRDQKASAQDNPNVQSIVVSKLFPFAEDRTTARVGKFSGGIRDNRIEPILTPYQNLKDRLVSELEERARKCEHLNICDTIKIAVSRIYEPELLKKLQEVRFRGLPVDVLIGFTVRKNGYVPPGKTPTVLEHSPWMWLRGNPFAHNASSLRMHTKYAIFGDDLVFSGNSNYSGVIYYKSRELVLGYHDPQIAAMFNELFSKTRTSLFYPLEVNLKDPFILLFGADRPLGYSAFDRKPHVLMKTNEEVRSTAYGILFELIRRSKVKLTLLNSPLTNYCNRYKTSLCFYDLLEQKAEDNQLQLYMNASFYFKGFSTQSAQFWDFKYAFFSDENLKKLFPLKPEVNFFRNLNEKHPGSVQLRTMLHQAMSTLHYRTGILGDYVLNGSANYSYPSSYNTIEVVKSPKVKQLLEQEISTYDEPYFVAPAHYWLFPEEFVQADCEFVYERDLFNPQTFNPKLYRGADLVRELERKYRVRASIDDLTYWKLDWKPDYFKDQNLYFEIPKVQSPLEEAVKSYSSYFCLQPKNSKQTFVVRAPAR